MVERICNEYCNDGSNDNGLHYVNQEIVKITARRAETQMSGEDWDTGRI